MASSLWTCYVEYACSGVGEYRIDWHNSFSDANTSIMSHSPFFRSWWYVNRQSRLIDTQTVPLSCAPAIGIRATWIYLCLSTQCQSKSYSIPLCVTNFVSSMSSVRSSGPSLGSRICDCSSHGTSSRAFNDMHSPYYGWLRAGSGGKRHGAQAPRCWLPR